MSKGMLRYEAWDKQLNHVGIAAQQILCKEEFRTCGVSDKEA